MSSIADAERDPDTDQVRCVCVRYCRGGKWVSQATWYRHAPYRSTAAVPPLPSAPSAPLATHPAASTPSPASSRRRRRSPDDEDDSSEDERGSKRSRTSPPVENDNEVSMWEPAIANEDFDPDAPVVDLDNSRFEHDSDSDSDSDLDIPEPGSLDDVDEEDEDEEAAQGDPDEDGDDGDDGDVDSDFEEVDGEGLRQRTARLQDLRWAQQFQEGIRKATLENSGMDEASIDRLRNPPTQELELDDPDLKLAVKLFLETNADAEDRYTGIQLAIQEHPAGIELPSLDDVRTEIAFFTGVFALHHDMCHDSCVAFTGPFAAMQKCPDCGLARVNEQGETRKLKTMPLGPQLQAMYRNAQTATLLGYRVEETERVERELLENDGKLKNYNDLFGGTSYRARVKAGDIKSTDVVVIGSIDGAQLYRNKQSDAWISIWIIADLPPDKRYKKIFVLPDFIVGGPNKPKNMDSFSYPSLHHLSAIQQEGLPIWNAATNTEYLCRPFLLAETADGPGLTSRNGLVGHVGAKTCRIPCEIAGRHKPNISMHYPVMLKPLNYKVPGCAHDDVDPRSLHARTEEKYRADLDRVLSSTNATAYRRARKDTGICKPSIYDGLPPKHRLAVTELFPADLMHWASLNWTDLMLALFRGIIECEAPDSKASWPWLVLIGEIWKKHGEEVANATPYLPGSFDRPPRNPALKISSGYKAWELLLYIIGMGPVLFLRLLPREYWKHFCKGVYIIRVFHQRSIPADQLVKAHQYALEYVLEFETLYYQRMATRIHFVRPSIHSFIHLAWECVRLGPQYTHTQWTLERTVENLTREMHQPSKAYANLSEIALRRGRINALYAMRPELDRKSRKKEQLPQYSYDAGNGAALLRKRDRYPFRPNAYDTQVICSHLDLDPKSKLSFKRWGRARLPNGQIARSEFGEEKLSLRNIRRARCVKVRTPDGPCIMYVRYYFVARNTAFALGDAFGSPDADLLRESYGTVWSSKGVADYMIASVNDIDSVVAMVPYQDLDDDEAFFLVEKPGLDMATVGGFEEPDREEEGAENEIAG